MKSRSILTLAPHSSSYYGLCFEQRDGGRWKPSCR